MTDQDAAIEDALAALETALDAFGAPPALEVQALAEIDVAADAEPIAPAAHTRDVERALEGEIEALRTSLGDV